MTRFFSFLMLLLLCAACAPALPTPTPRPWQAATPVSAPTSLSARVSPAAPQPTQPVACSQSAGRLAEGEISTPLLDKPLRYQVYLPPCYQQYAPLPTLYLLHGQASDETQWLRLGLQAEMDALLQTPGANPFAVVLPFDYSYKQPREYGFEQAFLNLLMPEVEARFGLATQRQGRAIGGLSRGGAWALYLASRHPELFSAVGAHSPAVFYSDTGAFPLRLRAIDPALQLTFYVDAGRNDPDLTVIEAVVRTLDELDFPYEWHANQGFHDEKYWSAHLQAYLRWYALQLKGG